MIKEKPLKNWCKSCENKDGSAMRCFNCLYTTCRKMEVFRPPFFKQKGSVEGLSKIIGDDEK